MEHRSSNVHPENSREADKAYSCYCVLVRVLCSVALKVDSKKLVPALFHFPSRHQDLENCTKEDCEDDYFHAIPFQAFADCSCEEGIQYETTHALELQILEHQLLSFPKAVQRKLIHFLFQELCPSYCLVLRGETDGGKYKVYQGSLYAD